MKKILALLILITFGFNSNNKNSSELDLFDVYDLKINNVELFGNISSQLDLLGLPDKISQNNKELTFETSDDILSLIKKTENFTSVTFKGIEFWSFSDLESIPCKIDFRKFEKKISNKNLTLNREYEFLIIDHLLILYIINEHQFYRFSDTVPWRVCKHLLG